MLIEPRPSSRSIRKAEDIESALEDCPDELRHKIEFRVTRLEDLDIPAEKFDLALLSWSL